MEEGKRDAQTVRRVLSECQLWETNRQKGGCGKKGRRDGRGGEGGQEMEERSLYMERGGEMGKEMGREEKRREDRGDVVPLVAFKK